jgi:neutral ceramidase
VKTRGSKGAAPQNRPSANDFVDSEAGSRLAFPEPFLVGVARIDITPPIGIELAGFVAREQPSTGIHDPLYVRALSLRIGSDKLLWIHADLIGLDSGFVSRLTGAIGAKHAFRPEQIVVSASHTHSGPPSIGLLECGELKGEFEKYLDELFELVIQAADQALSKDTPCVAFVGSGDLDLAIDRRGKPSAHVDCRLGIVGFAAPVEEPTGYIAVLANFPVHPVSLGPDNRLVSGDLHGFAAAELEGSLPGEPVVLFTNGACANLNPPSRADFEQAEGWASQIAQTAQAALLSSHPYHASLASAGRTIPVPTARIDGVWLNQRVNILSGMFEGEDNPWNVRSRKALKRWTLDMLDKSSAAQAPRAGTPNMNPQSHLELELQAVRIGPLRFACFGAEVFSVMTDKLRMIHSDTFVVGYANGCIGYLSPAEAFEEGGYETDSAFMFYGSPPHAPGGFESAAAKMADLIWDL